MGKTEWVDTKREYEVNSSGTKILKSVTSEAKSNNFERKDLLDLFFKFVGIAAIGLPIYLVSVQQKAAITSDRAKQQSGIFENAAAEFRSITTKPVNSVEFTRSINRLTDTLSSKIDFWFSAEVSDSLEEINKQIPFYVIIANNSSAIDTLCEYELTVGSSLSGSRDGYNGPQYIDQETLDQKKILDSAFTEFQNKKNEIKKASKNLSIKNTDAIMFADEMTRLNEKYMPFHQAFKRNIESVILNMEKGIVDNVEFDRLDKNLKDLHETQKENPFDLLKNEFKDALTSRLHDLQTKMKQSNKLLN